MKNKTFIITYQTNYGLGVSIINTETINKAKLIVDNSDVIWKPYSIEELNTTKEICHLEY